MWHPNCCDGVVISLESGCPQWLSTKLTGQFAAVTNRKESWQGLEQDISNRISACSTYTVCAWVGLSRATQGVANVQATLKLEYQDSSVSYQFIGKYGFLCFSQLYHQVAIPDFHQPCTGLLLQWSGGRRLREHFQYQLCLIGPHFIWKGLHLGLICL